MLLSGRLRNTTLGDLLGALHRARATGVLGLDEDRGARAGREHRVRILRGLVEDVETTASAARLGEILCSEGFLDRDRLRRILAAAPLSAARLGERLVQEGWVEEGVVSAALRYQVRARLESLESLDDARVAFHLVRERPSVRKIPLSPREFLHGRARSRNRAAHSATPPPASGARVSPRESPRGAAFASLGLSPHAGADDVRRAFRKLAATHHPDRFPNAGASERERLVKRFAEMSQAYHALVG